MESNRWRNVGLAIVVIAAAVFVLWRVRTSGDVAPATAASPRGASSVAIDEDTSDRARTAGESPRSGARAASPASPSRSELDDSASDPPAEERRGPALGKGPITIVHGVDPCEPAGQPEIPSDFDSVTAQDVTVAWPLTVAIAEPTLLAHLAAGLLEEAALLTDSDRRARLTIFLHPTLEDLRALPLAPKWSTGLYDGAVHVVANARSDFGVRLESLRHEIMHAHLHVAAGCAPTWLNEGAAMLFAGRPPSTVWKRMMRTGESLPFDALSIPTVANSAIDEKSIDLAYAQGLAMVLYLQDHTGLDGAVHFLRDAKREVARKTAAGLWPALYPDVTTDELRAWLTRRIFRLEPTAGIGSLFTGGVCCTGERRLAEFACDTGPLRGQELSWFDGSASCTAFGY